MAKLISVNKNVVEKGLRGLERLLAREPDAKGQQELVRRDLEEFGAKERQRRDAEHYITSRARTANLED